jgi:hypothetical protein
MHISRTPWCSRWCQRDNSTLRLLDENVRRGGDLRAAMAVKEMMMGTDDDRDVLSAVDARKPSILMSLSTVSEIKLLAIIALFFNIYIY